MVAVQQLQWRIVSATEAPSLLLTQAGKFRDNFNFCNVPFSSNFIVLSTYKLFQNLQRSPCASSTLIPFLIQFQALFQFMRCVFSISVYDASNFRGSSKFHDILNFTVLQLKQIITHQVSLILYQFHRSNLFGE